MRQLNNIFKIFVSNIFFFQNYDKFINIQQKLITNRQKQKLSK